MTQQTELRKSPIQRLEPVIEPNPNLNSQLVDHSLPPTFDLRNVAVTTLSLEAYTSELIYGLDHHDIVKTTASRNENSNPQRVLH